ncbi:MAG: PIN domain-containing protein [Planctomycetes bacterium]|nr:PIN domain-containing protein [Planctomycetota bacterium]
MLAEVLVKPLLDGSDAGQRAYQEALRTTGGLRVEPVSREILVAAVRVRATQGFRLPDAIHLATAAHTHCGTFLTNDASLRKATGTRVLVLSEIVRR